MAEEAFLNALGSYLGGVGLSPAPGSIGIAEPEAATSLPAVVLSLESSERAGNGLGQRSSLIIGQALEWAVRIDLEKPFLPDDTTVPPYSLVDITRRSLTLPHGGQVRSDGSIGELTGADLSVKVNGASRPVVTGTPADDQVRAVPAEGRLEFATALPTTGTVEVEYFLGQWEQRLERISGMLRVDICASTSSAVAGLGTSVIEALLAPAAKLAVKRLLSIGLRSLTSVGLPEQPLALRRRTLRFAFSFEHEVNQPESSGGIIREIPIHSEFLATGEG